MSADNGILIRRNEELKYEVREYYASVEYDDNTDMLLIATRDTLEEAIKVGQKEGTEYGLSFDIEPDATTLERYEVLVLSSFTNSKWTLSHQAESFAQAEEQAQSYLQKADQIIAINKDYKINVDS